MSDWQSIGSQETGSIPNLDGSLPRQHFYLYRHHMMLATSSNKVQSGGEYFKRKMLGFHCDF